MLVIQQNCGKEYEGTISALEAGLGLDAAIVCIQEPFLGNQDIIHCQDLKEMNSIWAVG